MLTEAKQKHKENCACFWMGVGGFVMTPDHIFSIGLGLYTDTYWHGSMTLNINCCQIFSPFCLLFLIIFYIHKYKYTILDAVPAELGFVHCWSWLHLNVFTYPKYSLFLASPFSFLMDHKGDFTNDVNTGTHFSCQWDKPGEHTFDLKDSHL